MVIFFWDDWNEDHIAKHGVSPAEAKEVASNAQPPYPIPKGAGKWVVRGSTSSGRHLQVIYVYRPVESIDPDRLAPEDRLNVLEVDEVAYVIHARNLLEREQRSTRRKRHRP